MVYNDIWVALYSDIEKISTADIWRVKTKLCLDLRIRSEPVLYQITLNPRYIQMLMWRES